MTLMDDPWNRFVDRAIESASRIEAERPLYALLLYQADVNNGGHHQYFHNWPSTLDWKLAVAGARKIGQLDIASLLEQAIEVWQIRARPRPSTLADFGAEARACEFDDFDTKFYELEPALQAAFERFINENEGV